MDYHYVSLCTHSATLPLMRRTWLNSVQKSIVLQLSRNSVATAVFTQSFPWTMKQVRYSLQMKFMKVLFVISGNTVIVTDFDRFGHICGIAGTNDLSGVYGPDHRVHSSHLFVQQ